MESYFIKLYGLKAFSAQKVPFKKNAPQEGLSWTRYFKEEKDCNFDFEKWPKIPLLKLIKLAKNWLSSILSSPKVLRINLWNIFSRKFWIFLRKKITFLKNVRNFFTKDAIKSHFLPIYGNMRVSMNSFLSEIFG